MPALDLPAELVPTDWLADHLGDPGLVIVDASVLGVESATGFHWLSGLDEYLVDGHVPGAVFADLLEEFSDPDGPFSFTRPDATRLERVAHELGIDDEVAVVVYDTGLGQWAARLWWVLRSAGVARVALLDGGLRRWKADGRELETGYEAPRTPRQLTLSPDETLWADREEVRAVVEGRAHAALVCASPESDFRGETGRRPRRGHIPGSVSVPLAAVVDRDRGTLRRGAHFTARARVVPPSGDGGRIVVYCGAGIAAAATAFALRQAGETDVAVYDGSLDEWAADPEAPLVSLV
ncbi:thiosulfate/3-mercaptopyruvate sulfurtransferase [Agromyces sp. 3263]|uniref:sulfurtransferase n=1 Tax=Agromyces sp. 3263 TaxID=2817750 RepID=UPI002866F1F6|nr:rhodanese-like domain-containing protein [Agromyces sp. 3263]MDR6908067.1 thiosulfate/3-mercaptopyruvate sulfurtransferase [Agromyces sp. 3263]